MLFLYLWDKKKLVTNNKKLSNFYIWHSGCPNYQINECLFFIFRSVCERGVVVWGSLYFINSLQKTRQPPSCIKFLQILSSSCIHLILVILFFWMGGGRENKILQKKNPNRAFHFFTTIKLIYTLVSIFEQFFFSVFWNMNLSQTVSNHIIGI